MIEVRDLHSCLHRAIEEHDTAECLAIIDRLCPETPSQDSFKLDHYSHDLHLCTPFLHSILKENATVALYLLEKGCNSRFGVLGSHSFNKIQTSFGIKTVFQLIGKPGFDLVALKVQEVTGTTMLDEDSNTLLHVICEKKLTSWLHTFMKSPAAYHLLSHFNNEGYLPMHVAAQANFIDFFKLVYPVSSYQHLAECFPTEREIAPNANAAGCSGAESNVNIDGRVNQEEVKGDIVFPTGRRKKRASKDIVDGNERNINTPILGKALTVLHIAAQSKFHKLVELLISLGAEVNGSHVKFFSPFFFCLASHIADDSEEDDHSEANLLSVCRLLIAAGTNVNEYCYYNCSSFHLDNDMVTPLHLAASKGCREIVELLIQNGAEPMLCSKIMRKLPLQMALEEGQNKSASVLLNPALYPDRYLSCFADISHNSLLHAAGNCNKAIIRELIRCGCPLDRPNLHKLFPLDKAIFFGNIPYIETVLSIQPDMVNSNKMIRPPLHLAASSSLHHLPLCKILLSYGANIYAKAYGTHMAYRRALKLDCYESAVYLCRHMSRPFTMKAREELLRYAGDEERMGTELASAIKCRLDTVPSLVFHCLDAVQQVLIQTTGSFKAIDSLPVPEAVIRALKYQDKDQSRQ